MDKRIASFAVMYTGFIALFVSFDSLAASFGCGRPTSRIEKAICDNPTLSDLDSQLASEFRKRLQDRPEISALREDEANWLKNVRDRCTDDQCVGDVYTKRIDYLKRVASVNAVATVSASPSKFDADDVVLTEPASHPVAYGDETRVVPASCMRTDKDGVEYECSENENGWVLRSGTTTLYLGKSCDAASPQLGGGIWRTFSELGFGVHFDGKDLWFPKQAPPRTQAECVESLAKPAAQARMPAPAPEPDRSTRATVAAQAVPATASETQANAPSRQPRMGRNDRQQQSTSVAVASAEKPLTPEEERQRSIAKSILLAFVIAYIVLLIGGVSNKFVIFYDKKDFFITVMVFLSPSIGFLLFWFFEPHGHQDADPPTLLMQMFMYAGLAASAIFALWTVMLSVRHNRNIPLGIAIGLFKTVTAVLAFLVLLAFKPYSKTDTLGGAINRQREWGIFLLVIGLLGWLASKLINGERVYEAKGWDTEFDKSWAHK